jgi:hypothetical protein
MSPCDDAPCCAQHAHASAARVVPLHAPVRARAGACRCRGGMSEP